MLNSASVGLSSASYADNGELGGTAFLLDFGANTQFLTILNPKKFHN